MKKRYNGIYREENYPYSEIALREVLLNAIAHKDYSSGSPIQIKVYKDGLFIWNDGEMPKPTFDLSMGGVDARFVPKIFKSNTTLLADTTSKSTLKTKELIEENPYITISELAEKLSISKRAVDKQIAKLKENGIIERIGADKGGYWKIINK